MFASYTPTPSNFHVTSGEDATPTIFRNPLAVTDGRGCTGELLSPASHQPSRFEQLLLFRFPFQPFYMGLAGTLENWCVSEMEVCPVMQSVPVLLASKALEKRNKTKSRDWLSLETINWKRASCHESGSFRREGREGSLAACWCWAITFACIWILIKLEFISN